MVRVTLEIVLSSQKTTESRGGRRGLGLGRLVLATTLTLLVSCSGPAPQVVDPLGTGPAPDEQGEGAAFNVEQEFRATQKPVVFEFDVLKHVNYTAVSLTDLVSESGKAALECEQERGDSGVDGPGHRCAIRHVAELELGANTLIVASVERAWRADETTWGHTTDILLGKPVSLNDEQECCRVDLVGRYPAAQVNSWRTTTNLTLHRDAVAVYQDETVLCIEEVVEEGPGSTWLDGTGPLDEAWTPSVRGHRVAAFRYSARSGLMERAAEADRECPQRGYAYLLAPSLDDGRLDVRTVLAASGEVRQIATNGEGLVAEAANGVITLWTGERKASWQLRGHRAPITALAFSSDAATLYSADLSGRIAVWDVLTGAHQTLTIGRPIFDLALAPDQAHLALALRGTPTVAILTLSDQALTPMETEKAAWTVAFASDGALAAGGEGWLGVWDVEPSDAASQHARLRTEARTAELATGALDVAFDGAQLYVADAKGALSRWTASPLILEATVEHPAPAPLRPERLSIAVGDDGVFSSSADGQVFFWRGERETALDFEADPRASLTLSAGVLQASGPNGGVLRWSERLQSELTPLNPVPQLESEEPQAVSLLALGDLLAPESQPPNSEELFAWLSVAQARGDAIAGHGDAIYVQEGETIRVLSTSGAAPRTIASDPSITELVVSPDGGKLFGASADFVRTWPLPAAKTFLDKVHTLGAPRDLESSADGDVLALLGASTVEIWRTEGKSTTTQTIELADASALALSADGKWLALRTSSELQVIDLLSNGVQRRSLLGAAGGVAFGEAGQLVCLSGLRGGDEWWTQTWVLDPANGAWAGETQQFGGLEGADEALLSTTADKIMVTRDETVFTFDLQ